MSYRFLRGLGLVPDGPRAVTPVPPELLALVPKPKNIRTRIKADDCDPERDTVPLMKKMISETAKAMKPLGDALKGKSVEETVRNFYDFVFKHIQYVEDPQKTELVRDPQVTIYDGKGDCDCFTVLIGSLISGQKIPVSLRIAAYQNKGEWGHVYIMVPDKGKEIIADPVVHEFNYEAPAVDKKDFKMELVRLSGLGDASGGCVTSSKPGEQLNNLVRYANTEDVTMFGYVVTQKFLEDNQIPYTQETDESTGAAMLVVKTPIGTEVSLPSVMNQSEASKFYEMLKPVATGAPTQAGFSLKNINWWWVVGGVAALWLISGSDDSSPQKESSDPISLGGTKKKKKKARVAILNI